MKSLCGLVNAILELRDRILSAVDAEIRDPLPPAPMPPAPEADSPMFVGAEFLPSRLESIDLGQVDRLVPSAIKDVKSLGLSAEVLRLPDLLRAVRNAAGDAVFAGQRLPYDHASITELDEAVTRLGRILPPENPLNRRGRKPDKELEKRFKIIREEKLSNEAIQERWEIPADLARQWKKRATESKNVTEL
ncbi:MAG: hypothetical protein IT426_00390 [Pirellulales bacterium]|nr:hypothetical protein [Pirellulales bacterium]